MHNCPLLAPKQTFARIVFLRQGGRLVDGKSTFCVKFPAESLTKVFVSPTRLWATPPKSTYAYKHQRERLQGIQPTANGDSIIEMEK